MIFHACGGQYSVFKGQNASQIGKNWAPDRSDFGEGVFIFLRFGGFKNPWGGFIAPKGLLCRDVQKSMCVCSASVRRSFVRIILDPFLDPKFPVSALIAPF